MFTRAHIHHVIELFCYRLHQELQVIIQIDQFFTLVFARYRTWTPVDTHFLCDVLRLYHVDKIELIRKTIHFSFKLRISIVSYNQVIA